MDTKTNTQVVEDKEVIIKIVCQFEDCQNVATKQVITKQTMPETNQQLPPIFDFVCDEHIIDTKHIYTEKN